MVLGAVVVVAVAVVVGSGVVVAWVVCGDAVQAVVDLPEPSSHTSVTSTGRGVGVTGGLGRAQPADRLPTPRRVRLTVFRRGLAPCTS